MTNEHPARELYQLRFESRKPECWRHPDNIAEATHATILMRHGPYETEVLMELPEDERERRMVMHRREQIERLIQLAYDAGDRAARADIRRALGVKEPRP